MDAAELRRLQDPIKEKYKANPAAALVTLTSTSNVGEGITCKIETGSRLVEAGLHPATGGDGLSLCSGDMLLDALTACAGVTLKAVATAIGFDLQEGRVVAEGDLDFRGTLSVDKSAPVGFKAIRLFFEIKTQEPQEKTDTLIKLTERFCVVYQTLRQANTISVAVRN